MYLFIEIDADSDKVEVVLVGGTINPTQFHFRRKGNDSDDGFFAKD